MNGLQGGQGRSDADVENDMDIAAICLTGFLVLLTYGTVIAAITLCSGCGSRFNMLERGQVDDVRHDEEMQPSGDLLPAPARVRSQYLGGDKPRECATQAETSKALKAADDWVKDRTFILHEKE